MKQYPKNSENNLYVNKVTNQYVNENIEIENVNSLESELANRPAALQANTTVNIPYGSTAAEIQALIAGITKNLNSYTLTFQFADCPHKYFDGASDIINSDGSIATVVLANHGFASNDEISIQGTVNFNGEYTITVIDSNTFSFVHTYSGSEMPPITAIAVKVWLIDTGLSINGFGGNGTINVYGNTGESQATTYHTTQRVVLRFTNTDTTLCLRVRNNANTVNVRNLRLLHTTMPADYALLSIHDNIYSESRYCSLKGTTGKGYGVYLYQNELHGGANLLFENLALAVFVARGSNLHSLSGKTIANILQGVRIGGGSYFGRNPSLYFGTPTLPTGSTYNESDESNIGYAAEQNSTSGIFYPRRGMYGSHQFSTNQALNISGAIAGDVIIKEVRNSHATDPITISYPTGATHFKPSANFVLNAGQRTTILVHFDGANYYWNKLSDK